MIGLGDQSDRKLHSKIHVVFSLAVLAPSWLIWAKYCNDWYRDPGRFSGYLLAVGIGIFVTLVLTLVLFLVFRWLTKLPALPFASIISAVLLFEYQLFLLPLWGRLLVALWVLLLCGGFGTFLFLHFTDTFKGKRHLIISLVCASGLIFTFVKSLQPGASPHPLNWQYAINSALGPEDLPDPLAHSNQIQSIVAYGPDEDGPFHTEPRDGAKYIKGWEGFAGKDRTAYWGFGPDALPLSGTLFLPEGAGPFPVVALVHGNNKMSTPSDKGYEYLADHLCRRGFVVVNMNQNFFNATWTDLIGGLWGDHLARGWLVLESLDALTKWSATQDHPLYGLLDPQKVFLLGHSRGGEAVAIAAAMSKMPTAPHDGIISSNYDFDIHGVIALASVTRHYLPNGKPLSLDGVNLMAIQGLADADIVSFDGQQQYQRTFISHDAPGIKCAFGILDGNHSQFNSVWKKDLAWPIEPFLAHERVMARDAQERVAKLLVTSFVELIGHNDKTFLPWLIDPVILAKAVPESPILAQHEIASRQSWLDFGFDLNLTKGNTGVRLHSKNLSHWHETMADDRPVICLGWEAVTEGEPPIFILDVQPGLYEGDDLILDLAEGTHSNNARPLTTMEPMDFSIRLTDEQGVSVMVDFSRFGSICPAGKPGVLRKSPFTNGINDEAIFQSFRLPLDKIGNSAPRFDSSRLARVALIFDKGQGNLILGDIGLGASDKLVF